MKKELEQLDSLMDAMSEEDQLLALKNRLPYLFSKAYRYLKMGSDKYSKFDAFKLPPSNLTKDQLDAIENGCKQLLKGIGLKEDNPFINLHINGFNLLFEMMHFDPTKRLSVSKTKNGKVAFLDEITLKHMVDDKEITYFNFVEYD